MEAQGGENHTAHLFDATRLAEAVGAGGGRRWAVKLGDGAMVDESQPEAPPEAGAEIVFEHAQSEADGGLVQGAKASPPFALPTAMPPMGVLPQGTFPDDGHMLLLRQTAQAEQAVLPGYDPAQIGAEKQVVTFGGQHARAHIQKRLQIQGGEHAAGPAGAVVIHGAEEHIGGFEGGEGRHFGHRADERVDVRPRIEGVQALGQSLSLWPSHMLGPEAVAIQVVLLHMVGIHEGEASDAAAHEGIGQKRTGAAAADQGVVERAQALPAVFAQGAGDAGVAFTGFGKGFGREVVVCDLRQARGDEAQGHRFSPAVGAQEMGCGEARSRHVSDDDRGRPQAMQDGQRHQQNARFPALLPPAPDSSARVQSDANHVRSKRLRCWKTPARSKDCDTECMRISAGDLR